VAVKLNGSGGNDTLTGGSAADTLNGGWKSIPKDAGIVRIHVAGDFFNENYLRAWIQLASDTDRTREHMPRPF
jgi:Ca2+-binding RTX toxin-like protein